MRCEGGAEPGWPSNELVSLNVPLSTMSLYADLNQLVCFEITGMDV